jgi:hypothetical protein
MITIDEDEFSDALDTLFRRGYQAEIGESLELVAEYFEFLADRIYPGERLLMAEPRLISRFEAVYLWISDRLLLFPDAIRNQVRDLVDKKELCERFAMLATLMEDARGDLNWSDRPVRERPTGRLVNLGSLGVASITKALVRAAVEGNRTFPTPKDLSDIKITLRRLGQILRYASSLDSPEYDESLTDARDNYDPNLIDRNKLGVLINLLKMQVAEVPDTKQRQKLLHSIDRLEAEVRRPKVRWGVVIAGFFVLFGFMADLQAIMPDVYAAPLRTVETIISVLHKDAQVRQGGGFLSNEGNEGVPTKEKQIGSREFPMRSLPPELTEEDET